MGDDIDQRELRIYTIERLSVFYKRGNKEKKRKKRKKKGERSPKNG